MTGRQPAKKRNRKGMENNTLNAVLLQNLLNGVNNPDENQAAEDEEVENTVDGMGIVETYADYWPAKLKIGAKHPDAVVETASLSSVESADINYNVQIPKNVIDNGLLSALQLEAICYASQAHERFLSDKDNSRAGFLIGDGAGVGKGRTIAGIIFENFLQKRKKALWISVSNDLKYDAERDFHDIGAKNIKVHSLNKFGYNSRISSAANGKTDTGVIFCTYASLIGKSKLSGRYDTRMAQLVDWCGPEFDGCIVFDECHKAKNLIAASKVNATQTGKAVVDIQYRLPKARVVYSSATGASEPRNMAYMVRLGLWGQETAFRTFLDFEKSVERRGVGAMEIVAMDMKLRGMYVARQLSFQGVTFTIEKVPLSEEFISTYNDSVALWNSALRSFEKASYVMNVDAKTQKIINGQFWGAHQRFFKYLSIAAKVDHAVEIAQEAVNSGKCVVIGLQSTGEARMMDELDKCDGELEDYISTAKAVFQSLVEKQFPALDISYSSENELNVDETPSTSRKRKPTNVLKTTRTRAAKRSRKISSSEESSVDLNSDSESDSDEEYKVDVKPRGKSIKSEVIDVKKIKDESDFNPETESDSSDDQDSSDFDTPSEDTDSESDKRKSGNKRNSRLARNTKGPSKVQEYMIQQHKRNATTSKKKRYDESSFQDHIIDEVRALKNDLLKQIEELGERLPKNTLDDLINKFGGSEKVAEMTGRKGRVAGTSNGTVKYESRSEVGVSLEMLNIKEKERFMEGEKLIAIISEAASSGISLQSDRRVANRKRRVHITLELPWAADRAIQQFGRTHRSNQVNAPEYIFLISELAGEQRFVATVARRLESLGALTHADRRATQTRDLSEFNIDNKYGRKALSATIHAINKMENPIVPPPEDYIGDFFGDVHKALRAVNLDMHAVGDENRKSDTIVRFLNRSLGVPVNLQNLLFKYFSDTLFSIITKAKKEDKFDIGIMDVGKPERVTRISSKRFLRQHASGVASVDLHTVRVDRGMSFGEALEKSKTFTKKLEGFYIYRYPKAEKRMVFLAERITDDTEDDVNFLLPHQIMFQVYRPNVGPRVNQESLGHIENTFIKCTAEKAEKWWNHQYDWSSTRCSHSYWDNNCSKSVIRECDEGMRIQMKYVLSGSVLGVWDRIEKELRGGEDELESQNIRMQVTRLLAKDGLKTIGILIPKGCVESLSYALSVDAVSVEEIGIPNEVKKEEIDVPNPIQVKVEEMDVPNDVKVKVEELAVPNNVKVKVEELDVKMEEVDVLIEAEIEF